MSGSIATCASEMCWYCRKWLGRHGDCWLLAAAGGSVDRRRRVPQTSCKRLEANTLLRRRALSAR